MFTLIDDRVLVELRKKQERVSNGGIIVPEVADVNQPTQLGVVLQVGKNVWRENDDRDPLSKVCRVGDTIVFPQFGGMKLVYEGKEYRILNRDEILAVLDNGQGISEGT